MKINKKEINKKTLSVFKKYTVSLCQNCDLPVFIFLKRKVEGEVMKASDIGLINQKKPKNGDNIKCGICKQLVPIGGVLIYAENKQ